MAELPRIRARCIERKSVSQPVDHAGRLRTDVELALCRNGLGARAGGAPYRRFRQLLGAAWRTGVQRQRAAHRLDYGDPVPDPAQARQWGLVFRPRERVGSVGLAQAEYRSAAKNNASVSR